jgi:hypothetical protein
LTWSWENLLFACEQCNTSKGAAFPIAPDCARLNAEQLPPGTEKPMVIDPAFEDPRAHVQFAPAAGFWFPTARGGSAKGRATLEVLKWTEAPIAKPGLVENWKHHAAHVYTCVGEIESAMLTNDPDRIRGVWQRQTTRFRVARSEFVALSLDILERSFPEHVRERWNLSLDVIYL